jgi:hypothetical protein
MQRAEEILARGTCSSSLHLFPPARSVVGTAACHNALSSTPFLCPSPRCADRPCAIPSLRRTTTRQAATRSSCSQTFPRYGSDRGRRSPVSSSDLSSVPHGQQSSADPNPPSCNSTAPGAPTRTPASSSFCPPHPPLPRARRDAPLLLQHSAPPLAGPPAQSIFSPLAAQPLPSNRGPDAAAQTTRARCALSLLCSTSATSLAAASHGSARRSGSLHAAVWSELLPPCGEQPSSLIRRRSARVAPSLTSCRRRSGAHLRWWWADPGGGG